MIVHELFFRNRLFVVYEPGFCSRLILAPV
jgi:hypothetical protein